MVIQALHQQLLDINAIVFDNKHLPQYEEHILTVLDTLKDQKQEKVRADGFKLLRQYLELFYTQILKPCKDFKDAEAILKDTKFMTKITNEVLKNMSDYHDSVREEALGLLVSMTERFLPP